MGRKTDADGAPDNFLVAAEAEAAAEASESGERSEASDARRQSGTAPGRRRGEEKRGGEGKEVMAAYATSPPPLGCTPLPSPSVPLSQDEKAALTGSAGVVAAVADGPIRVGPHRVRRVLQS